MCMNGMHDICTQMGNAKANQANTFIPALYLKKSKTHIILYRTHSPLLRRRSHPLSYVSAILIHKLNLLLPPHSRLLAPSQLILHSLSGVTGIPVAFNESLTQHSVPSSRPAYLTCSTSATARHLFIIIIALAPPLRRRRGLTEPTRQFAYV